MNNNGYPLTKAQETLWVEWKHDPADTSYNTCIRSRLEGELDTQRLEQALDSVVKRFDSLRSCFTESQGLPAQTFAQNPQYHLPIIDVSNGAEEEGPEQEQAANKRVNEIWRQPIDLKTFPLFRAVLIRSASNVHYYIGVVPHIISDGVSAVLFLDAVSHAYNHGEKALDDRYGEKSPTWPDYLEHLKTELSEANIEIARRYWQETLRNASTMVAIGDVENPDDSAVAERLRLDVPTELAEAIRKMAYAERTTPYSLFGAALAAFLYRHTGQEDMVFGYPVSLRPRGFQDLFGMLVNLVPLRVDVSGNLSFRELVRRVHQRRKQDKKQQNFPALEIVRALRANGQSVTRLFNVSLVPTLSRLHTLNLDNIDSVSLDSPEMHIREDMSFVYEVVDGKLILWLEYRKAAFTEAYIKSLVNHFQTLFQQLIANPDRAINACDFLGTEAKSALLSLGQGRKVSCSQDRIQDVVARQPAELIALRQLDMKLTYGELHQRVRALAALIQQQNLPQNQPIAIFVQRSFEQIISLLGVLTSRHAYVPVDPSYPAERIRYILQDSGAAAIVVSKKTRGLLPEAMQFSRAVTMDEVSNIQLLQITNTGENSTALPETTAYVMYTSGSTGRPKGVVIEHDGLSARFDFMLRILPLQPNTPCLAHISYSFDVSLVEMFVPLMQGATLVLAPESNGHDPQALIATIEKHQIEFASFVPSLTRVILKHLPTGCSITTWLSVGEPLPNDMPALFEQVLPNARLYNFYGPTEATIYVSCEISRSDDPAGVTIGRPFDNVQLYILNEALLPQPVGVPGELYLGGTGVALGYHGRPELTQQRFIDNPWQAGRLYKTGDLAAWLPDGRVVHHGRMDTQVKLRGFRIELDEVASVVRELAGIVDALAHIINREAGPALCLYYVGELQQEESLRESVARMLPDYMRPGFYIKLEKIPTTPNGKLDRNGLPLPHSESRQRRAPRNETEQKLTDIWAQVLRLPAEKIGIYDDFFHLGGDSLMTLDILSRAGQQGFGLTIQDFINRNTIAELAEVARPISGTGEDQPLQGPMSLLPRQHKFFADQFVNPDYWNRCATIEFDLSLDVTALQQALDTVIDHHDGLRLQFVHQRAEIAKAGTHVTVDVHELPEANQQQANKQETIAAKVNRAQAGMRLDQPPLIRAFWFQHSGVEGGLLILVFHHLLLDMRSYQIILEDLVHLYTQAQMDMALELPNKTTSLLAWSEWLQSAETQQRMQADAAFWHRQVDAAAEMEKPDLLEGDQAEHTLSLDPDVSEALQMIVLQAHNTGLHELTFAALAEAWQQWTGHRHLYVNTCKHSRDSVPANINLARTVGWINTVYPLALPLDSEDMLPAIKKIQDEVPNKGLSFGVLKYISKDPVLAAAAEPDFFYNYVSRIDTRAGEAMPFRLLDTPAGIKTSAPENRACYSIYTEAALFNQRLTLRIAYNRKQYSEKSLQQFAALVEDRLLSRINNKAA